MELSFSSSNGPTKTGNNFWNSEARAGFRLANPPAGDLPSRSKMLWMKVLVTGATGYIGGRLVPALLKAGRAVRVLARDARRLRDKPWFDQVEVRQGDLLDRASLRAALADMDAAYYLVHSMTATEDFARVDREAASNFVACAGDVKAVVYLGGLMPPAEASEHLSSRAEVGEILRAGLPTTEFRAGPIVGSGSASFEMVRYVCERFPLMLAPRGVYHQISPVAVDDVISYLVAALGRPAAGIVDIGCGNLTFAEMVKGYSQVRSLRRHLYEFPLVKPGLCASLVGWLTPVPRQLAAPLLEGISHPLPADTEKAQRLFPEIEPLPYQESVRRAFTDRPTTSWRGATGSFTTVDREDWGGLYLERRTLVCQASPEAVFRQFCRLGGDQGWVAWNTFWALRGWFDELIGGPGLRRGRRHPEELETGEALDVWRVVRLERPHLLRLQAEMILPGQAWLEFRAIAESPEQTRLVITATMEPKGVPGWLYWWSTFPFHRLGFLKLAHYLATAAERESLA